MEFGIHVRTYDQVLEKKGNVTKAKWVPGGEIVIGPHVRMGRGKYGRVSTKTSTTIRFIGSYFVIYWLKNCPLHKSWEDWHE